MKNKKGFTLVELLAVIAILAILVIMALPAVLRMFTQARIDTFNNELNTLVRTTRQQYLLSGGQAATYSKESNPLSLTGNSSLNYCITINGEGQITELKATNGSYKYESNGIVSETNSSDIEDVESGYTLTCSGGSSSITYVNRQTEGSITVGDEVAIDTEHFYVISSDSTNTVLLAKYNLLVGTEYNYNDDSIKTLSSSDPGYGLQSESAKGFCGNSATVKTGSIPFSGKGYWDNANCVWNGSDFSAICPGTAGLKSEYANASNAEGKTGNYSTPYPYVYNSSMSSTAPSYGTYTSWGDTCRAAQDNGYTISYYVEGYVNTLKSLGAPSTIIGRLLDIEETRGLNCDVENLGNCSSSPYSWLNNISFWLGSAFNRYYVLVLDYEGEFNYTEFSDGVDYGIRPVIVIPTISMP